MDPQQSSSQRLANQVLWALALAALLYLVGLTIWLGVTGLGFPYQLDYGEGFLLHFVKEWLQGRPIYRAIGVYPYITSNYPPLTMILALALTPILGVTYAAGRLWTLLAILAVAAIILGWVRRASGRWLPSLAAALVVIGSPYIYHWAPLFRVDLLGLALTLGGLYAVWRGVESDRPRLLWLAMVLFVAALYTKQSFLFAPAAALAYLFFLVDRGQAVKLAAAMGALGGGLFLVVNALTGGGFWEGLVVSNVNPFLWDEFWAQQVDFFTTFAILGLLTVWYLVSKFLLERTVPLRTKLSPLDFYLLAALLSLGLAGKAGAWENYFFEALVAFALCAGLGLVWLRRYANRLYWILAPLLMLAQVALMWHTPRLAERYLQLTRQSNEAMAPILANTPDPI
ncbi:MAG: glycosyltransferase family 39 protein, partial [Anaerolineae bacterium]